MRNFNLSATVDLEIAKFKATAKQAEDAIRDIEDQLIALKKQKLTIQTSGTRGELTKINRDITQQNVLLKEQRLVLQRNAVEAENYASKMKQAGGAQNAFRSQVGRSNSVALEFNRIIQDAPFGIIGVGNNIQQLTANFAQLKAGGLTAGQALSASLASIVSPINLVLLGVSILTSALTAYQLGMFGSKEKTDDLKDALEALDEEIQATVDGLGALEQAFLDGAKGAVKEQSEIDGLFAILRDTNIAQNVRIDAYKKLVQTYPEVFKGLTQEEALISSLTTEYNILTEAIGKKALANALEGKLTEVYSEQLDQQKQFNAELAKENELTGRRLKAEEKLATLNSENSSASVRRNIKNDIEDINTELEKQEKITELTSRLINAQGVEAEQLKAKLVDTQKELAGVLGIEGLKTDKKVKPAFLRTFEEIIPLVNTAEMRLKEFQATFATLGSSGANPDLEGGILSNGFQTDIETLNAFNAIVAKTSLTYAQLVEAIKRGNGDSFESLDQFVSKLDELQRAINASIKGIEAGIENTIGDVAFAVGDALAGGGNALKAGGGALLSGLSSILNELGTYAIGVGITIEAVKTALKTLNGPLAIGAGIALIAVAGAFSAKGRQLSSSSRGGGGGGGSSFAGSSAGAGVGGSSFSGGGLGFQGFGDMTLTSKINGSDLVLVIDRAKNKNN
jgi:hypothetical protein